MDSKQTVSFLAPGSILDRESVAARLGIKGDFVRVPQLARALGICSNSIHAQIRSGVFPLPHRRIGRVIVVSLDDYVEWLIRPCPAGAPLAFESADAARRAEAARRESALEAGADSIDVARRRSRDKLRAGRAVR